MKKTFKMILAAWLMVLGAGVLSSVPVLAEGADDEGMNSLRLSPSGMRLTLTPGKTIQGEDSDCVSGLSRTCSVEVFNPGKEAFNYKVYVTPYAVTGSNNELSFSEDVRSNTLKLLAGFKFKIRMVILSKRRLSELSRVKRKLCNIA